MSKLALLFVICVPLGGKSGPEPLIPPAWDAYEKKAYGWDSRDQRYTRPYNKPAVTQYWPMSEWTVKWHKKRNAYRDTYYRATPMYYMTPFITREHTRK